MEIIFEASIRFHLILVGAIPHSTKGKDKYSGIINKMEATMGYNYDKLWKLLLDKKMNKEEFQNRTGISSSSYE